MLNTWDSPAIFLVWKICKHSTKSDMIKSESYNSKKKKSEVMTFGPNLFWLFCGIGLLGKPQ